MEIEVLYFNHNCNSYLLKEGDFCLLVDPGFNENNVLFNAIKRRGLKLEGILLTHGHYDHIEGLLGYKEDTPIYIYKDEVDKLSNPRLNCSVMAFEKGFVLGKLNVVTLEDKEIINFHNNEIKVIHTPFHTNGCVCYYIKALNTLISGDTLFYHAIGRNDLPTSETRNIKSSLEKIFALPHEDKNDTVVYPGHGPKTNLSREFRFFKNEYAL